MVNQKKRRGGLPSRARADVMVRVDPKVDESLRARAELAMRSRSEVCEAILTAVVGALDTADEVEASGQSPRTVVEIFGRAIAHDLARLGVLSKFAAAAFEDSEGT